jgi:hypothetical protein
MPTTTASATLKWDVLVTNRQGLTRDLPPGKEQWTWVPTSATLIFGQRDAVLVDAFLTVEQAAALVEWVAASGKNLTTIYVTHGHGDHFFGIGAVLNRFPNARAMATPDVLVTVVAAIFSKKVALMGVRRPLLARIWSAYWCGPSVYRSAELPGAPSTRRAIWVRALRIPCCRWARKRAQGGTTRWSRLWVRSLELPWRGSSFVSCNFSRPRCRYRTTQSAQIFGQAILD